MEDDIAEALAEIGLPAIIAGGWPAPLSANPDTIRAALFSGESLHTISRGAIADLVLERDGGRTLQAWREKAGWVVRLGDPGKPPDCFAARAGSKPVGSRVRMSHLRRLFPGHDYFAWQQVEEMMVQFISSAGDPQSVHWIGLEWPGK